MNHIITIIDNNVNDVMLTIAIIFQLQIDYIIVNVTFSFFYNLVSWTMDK